MANATRLTAIRDQGKPRKLGRYELEECLGIEGGIETFRARVRGLAGFDRIFAVKCLRRGRGAPIDLGDPFIKTAKRTASINDPRVARVLDADVIDGVAIAVTEFVHGLDLDRFREWAHVSGVLATGVEESAEKWQKIVAYVGAEVAGGLAAIHALSPPLIHGGLCPRNIIATARGGIKLLDVGLRQSVQNLDESVSPRALAYAVPDVSSTEPSPKDDMRALGVVLFELATGELPPSGAGSLAARKILDALWPSMADFIAGLLVEDPALRPSAAEAAKILSDFWSEIPDASMVAEMAVMVRNFSGFVADANVAHTPPPVEPSREEAAPFAQTPVHSAPSPGPHVPSASGSFLALGDGPTRAMPSGSYASAIFQSVPTDPSIPSFAEGLPETNVPVDARGLALKEEDGDEVMGAPLAVVPPISIEPEQDHALAPAPDGSLGGQTAVDSVPIPELAEWGAQALAALGDQAGVAILPLAPAPELPNTEFTLDESPPPSVSDPFIEEVFAFLPPSPPGEITQAPERIPLDADKVSKLKQTLMMPAAHQPLEDELIDEPHEPDAIMTNAFEAPGAPLEAPLQTSAAQMVLASFGNEPGTALEATAFAAEEEAGAGEWSAPRLAHAMVAPEADQIRGPSTRTARRSGAEAATVAPASVTSAIRASRGRRVAILIAVVAGVSGAVAAALFTVVPVVGKSAAPALPSQPPRSSKIVSQSVPSAALSAHAVHAVPAVSEVSVPSAAAHAPVTPVAPKVSGLFAEAPLAVGRATGNSTAIALSVASNPDGAMVWIDGEERGKTPCTVKLKPGGARLVLVHAGYLASQSAIDVREGAKVDLTLKVVEPPMGGEARFRAECKSQGKLPIVVDGKETGILCPYSKMRVEPGTHTIGVLVPSTGKIHEKEITLSAGVRSINFGD
ncbi:MAG TPA: PEGA domain-containing protein [Polyangia bacterium]